jgi:osmotically-inducible protein OsmY
MNDLLEKDRMDNDLMTKICDRIKWDKRVSLADLDFVVRDGVVIVSGCVDTCFKKSAALEVLSNIEGVIAVEDEILVPVDFARTDNEIQRILEAQVAEIVKIGGEHIEVSVNEGVVKLEGQVLRPRLKAMADTSAWELSGVRDVFNLIEIYDPPHRVPITLEANENIRF